ncbi:MAG: hypothetical protein RIE58_07845 [Vicingaceae bacterium]
MKLRLSYFIRFLGALLVLCITTSCQKESDRNGILAFINDETRGLIKVRENGDYKIQIAYYPSDLMALREIESAGFNGNPDSVLEELNDMFYLHLSFSIKNQELLNRFAYDADLYQKVNRDFSFNMKDYIEIITSEKEVIPCMYAHAPLTFGMSKANTLLMCYSKELLEDADWIRIRINDPGMGYGYQQVKINVEDIEELPRLKI